MASQLGSSLPSPANFKIFVPNPMLHLRLFDGYYNARGAAIGVFAPIVATENAQRLSQCSDSHRFRKAISFFVSLTIRSRSAEETGIAVNLSRVQSSAHVAYGCVSIGRFEGGRNGSALALKISEVRPFNTRVSNALLLEN